VGMTMSNSSSRLLGTAGCPMLLQRSLALNTVKFRGRPHATLVFQRADYGKLSDALPGMNVDMIWLLGLARKAALAGDSHSWQRRFSSPHPLMPLPCTLQSLPLPCIG
jgi:hypothetical protein